MGRGTGRGGVVAALSSLTTRTVAVTYAKADPLEFHQDRRRYESDSATPIVIGRGSGVGLQVVAFPGLN
jgi:hypothetical protein